jgi:hypothetical protein
MKTPTNLGGNNLVTWLQTATEIRMADLYTIALKSGTVLRYTTWDSNMSVQGNLFLAGPPHIKRSSIEEKLGLDVSSLDLEILAGLGDTVNGEPVLQLIASGAFDGAALTIDRLFMDSAGNQIGTVVRFSGTIGAVDEVGRTSAKLTVDALVSLLSQQLPNIILQPNCTNTLFDARCTLRKKNLLKFSEQFDNPGWLTFAGGTATAPVVTANAASDPNGNVTADRLVFPATDASSSSRLYQMGSLPTVPVTGSNYTGSVWMRADSPCSVLIFLKKDGQGLTFSSLVLCNVATAWQRFSVSGDASVNSSVSAGLTIAVLQSSPGASVYAWGAQFEAGLSATGYEATTSSAASFFETNTTQAGSTVNKLISLSAKADGFYDNGQIVFTSGANSGLTKAVKSYSGQQFFFNSPLPLATNVGDTFIAYPGCDKTQATCTAKFNNLANFGGFPYVPAPETAI